MKVKEWNVIRGAFENDEGIVILKMHFVFSGKVIETQQKLNKNQTTATTTTKK